MFGESFGMGRIMIKISQLRCSKHRMNLYSRQSCTLDNLCESPYFGGNGNLSLNPL